jgi:hypothetical protein
VEAHVVEGEVERPPGGAEEGGDRLGDLGGGLAAVDERADLDQADEALSFAL